jgi:hypothetical protein
MAEDPKTQAARWYEERVKELMNAWKLWRIDHPLRKAEGEDHG